MIEVIEAGAVAETAGTDRHRIRPIESHERGAGSPLRLFVSTARSFREAHASGRDLETLRQGSSSRSSLHTRVTVAL